MTIWIDADACPKPVKATIFKAAKRLRIETVLVANNGMALPGSGLVRMQVVGRGIDEADRYIAERCGRGDVVVTADIPLAADAVGRGAVVIDPRGTVYTAENVTEALATRNLMQELRESGVMEGGPAPLGAADRERFANALDRVLTRLHRQSG